MEISLTLSIVAVAVSVFSPVLITIVNHLFDSFQRRRRFRYEHKVEIIERYVSSAGDVIFSRTSEARSAFGKVCGEIYLYIPTDRWYMADALRDSIRKQDYEEAAQVFEFLCKTLCWDPPRKITGN